MDSSYTNDRRAPIHRDTRCYAGCEVQTWQCAPDGFWAEISGPNGWVAWTGRQESPERARLIAVHLIERMGRRRKEVAA